MEEQLGLDRTAIAAARVRWAALSLDRGWQVPADWEHPAVDALLEAIMAGADPVPAADRLGRSRGAAGVSLGEALTDLDVLVELLGLDGAQLVRAVSLGWAEGSLGPAPTIVDPYTGLPTAEYLSLRLGELYRQARAEGRNAAAMAALVAVSTDLDGLSTWDRVAPMVVVGDCLRAVFDAGETLAKLAPGLAVVLAPRGDILIDQVRALTGLLSSRTAAAGGALPEPRVWIESLPAQHGMALDLLDQLAR